VVQNRQKTTEWITPILAQAIAKAACGIIGIIIAVSPFFNPKDCIPPASFATSVT
jgi:hypothetical protein